jgi:CRISPR-associated protein (TIGR02584 family)
MMRSVRVVATAGQTPAILTELGWWTAWRGYNVESVLVWTTEDCRSKVERHLALHWDTMRQEVGAELLPERARLELKVLDGPEGGPLPDVRNAADADVVADQIHRDVRTLTQRDGSLVGWFAGGRKTMSSALQSAFTLYGRSGDLLLHALVHPEIEEHTQLKAFAWPTQEWANKVNKELHELVDVAEVPFLALTRYMLPELSGLSWRDLWKSLKGLETAAVGYVAQLEPLPKHRVRGEQALRFYERGECVDEVPLTAALARFYVQVVKKGEAGTGPTNNTQQQNAGRIEERFGTRQTSLVARFCVQKIQDRPGYWVPAHRQVCLCRLPKPKKRRGSS